MSNTEKLTRKIESDNKVRFDLHVNLIMVQQGVPKAKAQFLAWLEGVQGLEQRLSPVSVVSKP